MFQLFRVIQNNLPNFVVRIIEIITIMAIKFREIFFIMFCAASAAMLLIFIPLAILLSPSAGYASLGYHPYLSKLLVYGLFIPTVLGMSVYGMVKLLRKHNKERLQSGQLIHRPTDEQIALYETIRKQHQAEKEDQDIAMLSAIRQYIEITLSPYMKDVSLTILYNNVYLWYHGKKASLTPVCTDGSLSTLDLRHLVWNIGERCGWKGEQRARFIKQSFPSELKDVEVETIRRNLRQKGTCKIEIDVPEKGSFAFHYPTMTNTLSQSE